MGSFLELSGRSALGHKVQFVAIHRTPASCRIPAHPCTPSRGIPALQGLFQLSWIFVTLSPRRKAMTGVEEYSNALSLQRNRRFRTGVAVCTLTRNIERHPTSETPRSTPSASLQSHAGPYSFSIEDTTGYSAGTSKNPQR